MTPPVGEPLAEEGGEILGEAVVVFHPPESGVLMSHRGFESRHLRQRSLWRNELLFSRDTK